MKPAGKPGNAYVIQKHAARRMHYDFRLELDGVLKSWAVPEGPSLVAGRKRLAVHVEDHPLEYGDFEGVIPKGEYGAGTVMVWDRGTWSPEFDPEFGYRKGHLKFRLDGEKLGGVWHLVRMAPKPREKQEAWLLFKSDDEAARPPDAADILVEKPESVATGRDMDAIAREQDRVWSSQKSAAGKGEQKGRAAPRTPVVDASVLAQAKAGALPAWIEPCLPSSVDKAPSGKDWVHEIKHDGYRVQARIENGRATLLTRQGLDWTRRFQPIGDHLGALPVSTALIDGEIIVEADAGVASFTALVDSLRDGTGNLVLYCFDLLYLDGFDLREVPLRDRKAALGSIIAAHRAGNIRFSEHIAGDGDTIFRHASRLGLEGIVSKLASAPYRSGRSRTWLKIKAVRTDTFVVAGFVQSSVDKQAIGALVLGENVNGKLVASGHVGSGFTAHTARALWQKLQPLRTSVPPLKDETAEAKAAKWVQPVLAAEIQYRDRTGGGLIRHAVFRELLESHPPAAAARVVPGPGRGSATSSRDAAPPARMTNPSRLFWPEQGITKQGLADFYSEIADWILPHIAGRPLSLLRCPGGVTEQCFFQKHRWAGLGSLAREVRVPGEAEPMLAIDDLAGLHALVQAGVLEIHPWGSMADRPQIPDRATMDLDPGDNVPWERVIESARDVRDRLSKRGLRSFVKTTGGKGLHVVFPLAPRSDWDSVKRFTQALAEDMARERPDRYTASMAKRDRQGRIYVDYLRNGMGATAVAAYSTRARPGAAVSTPLDWDELGPAIRPNHFTVHNLPQRLAFLDSDPWDGFLSLDQALPDPGTGRRTRRPAAADREGEPAANGAPVSGAVIPPKAALARYWQKVAPTALAYLGRRPLDIVRHQAGSTFYHRGALPPLPAAVHQLRLRDHHGSETSRLWVDDLEGLLALVEIGVIELYPWNATVDHIGRPDVLVFGVAPGEAVEWDVVVHAALALRDLLKAEGLDSWPKLTGDRGLHVVAPIEPDLDGEELHRYAQGLAQRLVATNPVRYATPSGPDRSRDRLIVASLSGERGTPAVGAWSPRALPGFPIAAPLSWPVLQRGVHSSAFTISTPPPHARGRSAASRRPKSAGANR